jgi:hypothetical protein
MATDRENQIRLFVEEELKQHPEAQLADFYKNLFQDSYGPGHLIPDTTRAGAYLDWELQQLEWTDTIKYQALGTNHDFYRINLMLIKNDIIPRDTLLLAMVKSAKLSRNPDIESWKTEWNEVFQIIKKMKSDLPNLESDEKLISETLFKGKVVMDHSDHYEKTYHPHYRIIHKSVFESWLGKYILLNK